MREILMILACVVCSVWQENTSSYFVIRLLQISERKYKYEECISAFLDNPYRPPLSQKALAHLTHGHTTGGYISGEIKLAIALRLMTGCDALDLSVLFDFSQRWYKHIFIKWLILG